MGTGILSRSKLRHFLKWLLWLLPVAYMILIWTLSSMPSDAIVEFPDSNVDVFIKESMHLVEFAILYLLFVFASYATGTFSARRNILFTIIACLYGVTDEIHQSFVPYRSATVIDVIKDVIGVLISYYFVRNRGTGYLFRSKQGQ